MSSISPRPSRRSDQRADDRDDVLLAEHAHRVLGVEVEAHVHLHAADGREVVALLVEEQRLEHRLRRVDRRRLARAHHPIDVEERVLAVLVLVDRQRVADVAAHVDVVDLEELQLLLAEFGEHLEQLGGDLLAGLRVDLAGLQVDDVLGDVAADQRFVGDAERLDLLFLQLVGEPRGDLLAGLGDDLAGLGVDQVLGRLGAAQLVGVEGQLPAVAVAGDRDRLVEGREDFLAVHAERHQERRHRDLAAAVDARVHDVLGVELDVEPGAAIGNDAGGEEQLAGGMRLALVVVEEHARRAVHLRDDDALGAVDDEGAVVRHERHVAHVDVLLLDILDGLRAGLLVDVEHDEAQRHLQRRRVGHVALPAFLDVVLRRIELVANEFERRRAGEVGNREHRLEDGLQPLVAAPAFRLLDHQELVVGRLLHLDQVRHLRRLGDVPEELADAAAAREAHLLRSRCSRHESSSPISSERLSGKSHGTHASIGAAIGPSGQWNRREPRPTGLAAN